MGFLSATISGELFSENEYISLSNISFSLDSSKKKKKALGKGQLVECLLGAKHCVMEGGQIPPGMHLTTEVTFVLGIEG